MDDKDEDRDNRYDDQGNLLWPDYQLSDNQRQFVEDAKRYGYTVDFGYSGRGMYGKCCPSITVRRGDYRFRTEAGACQDSMGFDTVVYARS